MGKIKEEEEDMDCDVALMSNKRATSSEFIIDKIYIQVKRNMAPIKPYRFLMVELSS